jgi:hypothetical protein
MQNGAEESFWRRVSGGLTRFSYLYSQNLTVSLLGNNHWYIQALNSRNTFNTGRPYAGLRKNSPGFQTSLSILMNRVHFLQDTLKTKEVWLSHSTERYVYITTRLSLPPAKASTWFPIGLSSDATKRLWIVNCDCIVTVAEKGNECECTARYAYNKQALLLL